jgi:hypothetical protein
MALGENSIPASAEQAFAEDPPLQGEYERKRRRLAEGVADQQVGPMGFGLYYAAQFERIHSAPRIASVNAGAGEDALDVVNLGLHAFGADFTFFPGWMSVFSLLDMSASEMVASQARDHLSGMRRPRTEIFGLLPGEGEPKKNDVAETLAPLVAAGSRVVAAGDVGCKRPETNRKRAGNLWEYVGPGRWLRKFSCENGQSTARWGDAFVSTWQISKKSKLARDEIVKPGSRYAWVVFRNVDDLIPGTGDQAGRAMAERIASKVPNGWYVMYTAPDDAGEWKVHVSKGGVVRTFDLPDANG